MSGTTLSPAAFAPVRTSTGFSAIRAGVHRGVTAVVRATRAMDVISTIEGGVAFCVLAGAGIAIADIFGVSL